MKLSPWIEIGGKSTFPFPLHTGQSRGKNHGFEVRLLY